MRGIDSYSFGGLIRCRYGYCSRNTWSAMAPWWLTFRSRLTARPGPQEARGSHCHITIKDRSERWHSSRRVLKFHGAATPVSQAAQLANPEIASALQPAAVRLDGQDAICSPILCNIRPPRCINYYPGQLMLLEAAIATGLAQVCSCHLQLPASANLDFGISHCHSSMSEAEAGPGTAWLGINQKVNVVPTW